MKFKNKYLDELSGGLSKILVFDCEFWHVLGQEGDKKFIFVKNENFWFLSREIGGFFFTKNSDGSWNYKDHFFVTLFPPNRDVAFPISHFATVTPQTGYKLDELEHKLGKPWGEAYPDYLSEEGKQAHKEGIDLYKADPEIKKHHKPSSWYKSFMKHYSESMIIVKGKYDIESLENAAHLYGFKYMKPAGIVDIADWNSESKKLCNSAKLEKTYLCVKDKFNSEIKEIEKALPLGKAHDPSADAAMTLLIALYMLV